MRKIFYLTYALLLGAVAGGALSASQAAENPEENPIFQNPKFKKLYRELYKLSETKPEARAKALEAYNAIPGNAVDAGNAGNAGNAGAPENVFVPGADAHAGDEQDHPGFEGDVLDHHAEPFVKKPIDIPENLQNRYLEGEEAYNVKPPYDDFGHHDIIFNDNNLNDIDAQDEPEDLEKAVYEGQGPAIDPELQWLQQKKKNIEQEEKEPLPGVPVSNFIKDNLESGVERLKMRWKNEEENKRKEERRELLKTVPHYMMSLQELAEKQHMENEEAAAAKKRPFAPSSIGSWSDLWNMARNWKW